MKLHYFYQLVADQDDVKLAEAIASGVVPAGCLLGGQVIVAFRHVDRKPCDGCLAPALTRTRCGGTENVDELPGWDPKALDRLDSIIGDKIVSEFYGRTTKKEGE